MKKFPALKHSFCVLFGCGKISAKIVIKQKHEKLEFQLGSEISISNGENRQFAGSQEKHAIWLQRKHFRRSNKKKKEMKFSGMITRRNEEQSPTMEMLTNS